ncbi:restriction endonuclease (plasmid) [Embleya sp. NBC_00888]|uniref:restriction endonuclease n=1 Tax=Embleya sp. NBC_00888 TaxID=2975960 RepID=UPI002F906EAC|nr:restriction endonuclease [Embleya sp. NBC_00888]
MGTIRPTVDDAVAEFGPGRLGRGTGREARIGGFVRFDRVFWWLAPSVCVVAAYCGVRREWDLLAAIVVVAVTVIGVLYACGRLRPAVRSERRRWAPRTRAIARPGAVSFAAVDAMTGARFEEHVAELCRRDGCADVVVSGGAGDLGADVVARLPDGRSLVVQCKRLGRTRAVGSPDMQRFVGTARPVHHADVAVLVTNSRFTAPARRLAGAQDIVTLDRRALGRWMAGSELSTVLLGGTGAATEAIIDFDAPRLG